MSMEKIRKSFLRSSVMVLAVMVLSSSVAYAQVCIARGVDNDVRAEGVTEEVGMVELRCGPGDTAGIGFGLDDDLDLSITLNVPITNPINRSRIIEMGDNGLTYTDGADTPADPDLGDDGDYRGDDREVLSDDGMTIEWELDTRAAALNIAAAGATGQSVFIGGILANASYVGDDEDVTATVRVNGQAVHEGTIKLSDVTTGLDIKVDDKDGLQCDTVQEDDSITVTITFVEGFASALRDGDVLLVSLRGVPDGVTVEPSGMGTGTAMVTMDDSAADPPIVAGQDLAAVTLDTESFNSGVNVDDDDNVTVVLTAGSGQIMYEVSGTDGELAKEWNDVTLTFTWDAGEPGIGTASVGLGYDPVGGNMIPRYVVADAHMALEIEDCDSSMTFPFVTNQMGYDTGIALTNTSEEDGMCMLSFVGMNAPAGDVEMPIMAESVVTFGVSVEAPDFQGYITANCNFREGKGLAFITNGAGMTPSLAHGYLVATDDIAESD